MTPRERAHRIAAELLNRVELPSDTEPYVGAPPAPLAKPFQSPGTPNLVDAHRFGILRMSRDDAVAFLRTLTPSGTTPNGFGSSSADGVIRVNNAAFYAHDVVSKTVASAYLLVSVAPRTATTTWVRVDAQVVWRDLRDSSELVPAADRVDHRHSRAERHGARRPLGLPAPDRGDGAHLGRTSRTRVQRADRSTFVASTAAP